MEQAREQLRQDPTLEEAIIWHGRRLAYLGRYREAVAEFSRGLEIHPDSFRLLRHRGHRYITLRRFREAVVDLQRASELVAGLPDEVEADGLPNSQNIPLSTTQTNIWYHLGLARYLLYEFEEAEDAYWKCLELCRNDDMTCATLYWLYHTLQKQQRPQSAEKVLEPVTAEMEIMENHTYHQLLLLYKGEKSYEELVAEAPQDAVTNATLAYGLARYRFTDQELRNLPDFSGSKYSYDEILKHENWAAFGFIAAEVELRPISDLFTIP